MAKDSQNSRSTATSNASPSPSSSSRGENRDETRSGGSMATTGHETERKSISAIISQSLAEESQEGIDRMLNELKGYFDSSRLYVQENPREAAGLAIAAGVAAWALLGTKPGRIAFESGAAIAIPYVTKWFSRNMQQNVRH